MGSVVGGGKGGSSQQAAPAQEAAAPASNPYMDMYLQEQANQNQQALQAQQMNAQLMQAQQSPAQQPGMHTAQVQEQQGLEQPQQQGRDVWATIDALRGN